VKTEEQSKARLEASEMTYEEFIGEQQLEYMKSVVIPAAERRELIARELRQARPATRRFSVVRRTAALLGGSMVGLGERVSGWSMAPPAPTS
jgi:hypothetical protein